MQRLIPCIGLFIACSTDAQPFVVAERIPAKHAYSVTVDADGWETVGTEPVASEPPPKPFFPEPPGFPREDQYSSHDEACTKIIRKLVPQDKRTWQRAILLWCEHRNYHASRYQTVVSKVDGSQIHDRDRPTAWIFYERAVADGTLDPEGCPFHRINRKLKHPHGCRWLMRNWSKRFKRPKLTDKMRRQWYAHPHDMERFGARGPHDWNANAYRYLPGCWPPSQLDRFDVSITVTVTHALQICKKHGCVSKYDIKKHW